jgi:hypothetical protein
MRLIAQNICKVNEVGVASHITRNLSHENLITIGKHKCSKELLH